MLKTNNFGLPERDLNLIIQAIIKFPEIEKAIIFGSRAMGNYKKGSDIDIAIIGKDISLNTSTKLSYQVNEELPIPYFVDILNYKTLENPKLKEHIDEFGQVFYNKQDNVSGE